MKNSGKTTMMLKSKFSNQVHALLEPVTNASTRHRFRHNPAIPQTDAEKAVLYDKIVEIHDACSRELTDFFFERTWKKKLEKERKARGYIHKKKTSLKEYKEMLTEA